MRLALDQPAPKAPILTAETAEMAVPEELARARHLPERTAGTAAAMAAPAARESVGAGAAAANDQAGAWAKSARAGAGERCASWCPVVRMTPARHCHVVTQTCVGVPAGGLTRS
jgi:hypothetical protein